MTLNSSEEINQSKFQDLKYNKSSWGKKLNFVSIIIQDLSFKYDMRFVFVADIEEKTVTIHFLNLGTQSKTINDFLANCLQLGSQTVTWECFPTAFLYYQSKNISILNFCFCFIRIVGIMIYILS